ncbi:esterase/lipase family protein [Pseudonocardia phyllosphaerae]|uniref:esterase/lipase family protein n=1 Tax=Pseudonocardia phyllosphaerae TaxID=3390502 RepID=UPI003977F094
MSPRRRLMFLVVGILAVVAVVAVIVAELPEKDAAQPRRSVAQDRPGPVLLVPGYGGSRAALAPLADALRDQGREVTVLALDGDGTGDLNRQVTVLDDAVNRAVAGGAPSVDVVGYSAGGVVTGLWVARADGAAKARRVVTLAAPLAGTDLAASAGAAGVCSGACPQLAPGSALLGELGRARVGHTVPWLSVWTTGDRTVVPATSARLDGAVNLELQTVCPGDDADHPGLPRDRAVAGLVNRALSTAPIAEAPAGCDILRAAGRAAR